jgi:predicted nucleic acid-binding protein
MARIRAVIDTNVVFEGLTQRIGPAGTIVSAWMAELFQACVSQALAYEYWDVLARKLAPDRWARIRLVLDALLDRAVLVTSNLRDFEAAGRPRPGRWRPPARPDYQSERWWRK